MACDISTFISEEDEKIIKRVCEKQHLEVVDVVDVVDDNWKWRIYEQGSRSLLGCLCPCRSRGEVACFLSGMEQGIKRAKKV